jgi:hypothetical protein
LRLSFWHSDDIFLHVLNKFTKTVSLCNSHAAESLCAIGLEGRDSGISKEFAVTSARNGQHFLKGFPVYGQRDSGIGNPLKGNKLEVRETTCVYSSKSNDDVFD